jgi:mono/diheme cytochrome c family protein
MSTLKTETAVLMAGGLALIVLLLGVAGCRKNEGSASSPSAAQGNSAVAYGSRVFDAYGCVKCHPIGGQGGLKGPDLTHIGAKPGYTIDVLMLKVRNHPTMPGFQGRISDRDLMALGGYLVGLK